MATAPASRGPQPVSPTPQSSTNQPTPSPAQKQSHFDLSITLLLSTWPALTTAVQNSWGGPDSSGKRDWFAGAISDLFISNPSTDQEDLECVLLQVMEDEFEVRLEDESEVEVAGEILRMRRWCERGEFGEVVEMRRRWEERRGRKEAAIGEGARGEDDDSEDEDSEGGLDLDEDVEMDEAPALVRTPKEKVEPKVDEDGFTKVVGKKKR